MGGAAAGEAVDWRSLDFFFFFFRRCGAWGLFSLEAVGWEGGFCGLGGFEEEEEEEEEAAR